MTRQFAAAVVGGLRLLDHVRLNVSAIRKTGPAGRRWPALRP